MSPGQSPEKEHPKDFSVLQAAYTMPPACHAAPASAHSSVSCIPSDSPRDSCHQHTCNGGTAPMHTHAFDMPLRPFVSQEANLRNLHRSPQCCAYSIACMHAAAPTPLHLNTTRILQYSPPSGLRGPWPAICMQQCQPQAS